MNASSAERQKPPKRTRLLAGDFILDIVETDETQPFKYLVHRRSSGEILTLGEALTFTQAEQAAVWSVRQIIGTDPGFNFGDEAGHVSVA